MFFSSLLWMQNAWQSLFHQRFFLIKSSTLVPRRGRMCSVISQVIKADLAVLITVRVKHNLTNMHHFTSATAWLKCFNGAQCRFSRGEAGRRHTAASSLARAGSTRSVSPSTLKKRLYLHLKDPKWTSKAGYLLIADRGLR